MKISVKLPPLAFLMSGVTKNRKGIFYTGSYGTDPSRGCLCVPTLDYRVRIEYDGNSEAMALFAGYTVKPPWHEHSEKAVLTLGRFEATEDGILLAEQWLKEEIVKFAFFDRRKYHTREKQPAEKGLPARSHPVGVCLMKRTDVGKFYPATLYELSEKSRKDKQTDE